MLIGAFPGLGHGLFAVAVEAGLCENRCLGPLADDNQESQGLTHVDGNDVRHGGKRREAGAELSAEAGAFDLIGLGADKRLDSTREAGKTLGYIHGQSPRGERGDQGLMC